jgi:membrane protease YdiL (CAAX protease family)
MRAFTNNNGQIRAGWRLAIWFAIIFAIMFAYRAAITRAIQPRERAFLDPIRLIVDDGFTAIPVLIATLILMSIERRTSTRTWRDYYWPTRDFFGAAFWKGLLWGFLAISLDIGLIAAVGGYRITGLATTGAALAKFTLLWIAASMAIGIVEEFFFRAYQLRTLADGIGFWPAAIINSLAFGALHYFQKPYERWEDWVSVSLLGLFLCLAVRRTGTLAFAIGWHAAFDWGAIFFWSGRNAGELAIGRLLSTTWSGSYRLTGGMLGPEASWMMGIVIALLFAGFLALHPAARAKKALTKAEP